MYFKIDLDGNMLIILLYVDDRLLVGDHKDDVERIKCIALMESFEMAAFETTNLARVKLVVKMAWLFPICFMMYNNTRD
jgi:hypothetical protein